MINKNTHYNELQKLVDEKGLLSFLKFCEISKNSSSHRYWKFQLSILKNKKVLFLKKYFLSRTAKVDPKDGVSRSNFQWRFWVEPRQTFVGRVRGSACDFQLRKSVDCWELRDQHAEKSAYKTLSKFSSAESMTLEFFEIFFSEQSENSMNCVLNLPVILVETCFYFKQESID